MRFFKRSMIQHRLDGLFLVLALLVSMAQIHANAEPGTSGPQEITWTGTPLPLHLQVGQFRQLVFPQDVRVEVPADIAHLLETLQPSPGNVLFKAKASFDRHTIRIRRADNTATYILDVMASPNGSIVSTRLIDLVTPQSDQTARDTTHQVSSSRTVGSGKPLNTPPKVALVRFAAQALYAPERLIPTSIRIHRVPVAEFPAGTALYSSERGEHFTYTTVAQWAGFGLYVTAIKVVNQSDLDVEFDPRRVRGQWVGISAQHNLLYPVGDIADTTTWYLISDQPFEQAMAGVRHGQK